MQQTDFVIEPLLFHEEQQTTPRPDTCNVPTQTDHHAIVLYPSFASPKAAATSNLPTSSSTATPTTVAPPNITSASNKQPNADHWQYAELIPGPALDNPPPPALPSDYTDPIGGTPRRARSKTPPRSTAPTRTRSPTQARHPDPRYGSPVPKSSSATFLTSQPSPAAFVQPKRPPLTLQYQQPPPAHGQPTVPPPGWWPTTPSASHAPQPSSLPQAFYAQAPHPWPAYYQPPQTAPPTQAPPPTHPTFSQPNPTVRLTPPGTDPNILFDEYGRPLPPAQQPYVPEHDPWRADNH